MKTIDGTVEIVSADCVYGWAAAQPGIREIRVYVAGQQIGVAHLGLPRPDVAAGRPDLPSDLAGRSGYFFKMPAGSTAWSQPEVQVVLMQDDGATHELYRGCIIVSADDVPTTVSRSPFPREVCALLAAVNPQFASSEWTDALSRAAVEEISRLITSGSKEILGLHPWLRYLKSVWASFEYVQCHFPRFGEADPFRKDAVWTTNSHVELFAIAHHLYVLRSYGLSGSFLEFGCFQGFSTSMLSVACRELNITMEVFDSFQGLPSSSSAYYREGEFAGSLDDVRRHVSQFGNLEGIEFHPGFFAQTVHQITSPPLCVWMDVDLGTSSRDVMQILRLLPAASCVFSHECVEENFGPEGIRYRSGADDVVEPIVEAFRRERRIPVGRFIAGNTGAFWDRDHGLPVLPIESLLRVKNL
jgi:O-methyltransferase